MDWTTAGHIIAEVLTAAAAVKWNRRGRRRDNAAQAERLSKERARIEAERKEFESEKVSLLLEESKSLRKEMGAMRLRMTAAEESHAQTIKAIDRHQQEMHALGGKVEAMSSLYTSILEASNRKNGAPGTEVEAGKPDLYNRDKMSPKKRS